MPSKTTTKKTNSKSGLKRRFDLTNKRVQFFVVIAIVAVLGGGYYTVKSFAATTLYSFKPPQIACHAPNKGCFSGFDSQKNNIPIVTLGVRQLDGQVVVTTATTTQPASLRNNYNYNICAYMKGRADVELGLSNKADNYYFGSNGSIVGRPSIVNVRDTSAYVKHCALVTAGTAGNYYVVAVQRSDNSIVNISQIDIEPGAIPISTRK